MTIAELNADLTAANDAWSEASNYVPKSVADHAARVDKYADALAWIRRATKAYCQALLAERAAAGTA